MEDNEHYINSFDVTVPANSSKSDSIQLSRDGRVIEFDRLSYCFSSPANGALATGNLQIQIQDESGSNRSLFVSPQNLRNVAGDGSVPWKLPHKLRVNGSSRLKATFVNLTATDVRVEVAMHGVVRSRAPRGARVAGRA